MQQIVDDFNALLEQKEAAAPTPAAAPPAPPQPQPPLSPPAPLGFDDSNLTVFFVSLIRRSAKFIRTKLHDCFWIDRADRFAQSKFNWNSACVLLLVLASQLCDAHMLKASSHVYELVMGVGLLVGAAVHRTQTGPRISWPAVVFSAFCVLTLLPEVFFYIELTDERWERAVLCAISASGLLVHVVLICGIARWPERGWNSALRFALEFLFSFVAMYLCGLHCPAMGALAFVHGGYRMWQVCRWMWCEYTADTQATGTEHAAWIEFWGEWCHWTV